MQKILHVSSNPDHFSTISAAIAHIPAADQTPTVIEIEPGIYHEKLTIDKPYVTLRGMGKSVEPSIIIILGTVVFRMIWLVAIFRQIHTFAMLMDVYVVSWIFTGGAIFIIYLHHMKKIRKNVQV